MGATRRNRVSHKNWGEIVRAYEVTTEDYLHVADALGMNRSMRSIINENCLLTLNQRKANHLSISKALDGMLVSVKLARPVPAE